MLSYIQTYNSQHTCSNTLQINVSLYIYFREVFNNQLQLNDESFNLACGIAI